MVARAVHPGAILKEELEECSLSPTEFARQIDVPPNRIGQIIAGKRSVSADTALRLGHWFGVEAQFWMNLQAQFDLVIAERRIGKALHNPPSAAGMPGLPSSARHRGGIMADAPVGPTAFETTEETESCTMPECAATRTIYTYPDGTVGATHSEGEYHIWPT